MKKWNDSWEIEAKNIFEALKIVKGDRFAILYSEAPKDRLYLIKTLENFAHKRGIPVCSHALNLDEKFTITALEKELYKFFEGTQSTQRKFFFNAARMCFGPSRRLVHKLTSVDNNKLCGYTISLGTNDPDIISSLASASPNELWEKGERLKKILSQATTIRITSLKGTDIKFDWDKKRRNYLISAGMPHTHQDRWDNMGGEVFTAPLHDTVNGRLVIDGAISGLGLVDGTAVVNIKNGKGILDRKTSTASKKILDEFDEELNIFPCASIVGEFGIGTTPNLKLVGELLNDEKVEGTIHIAFGDSYSADGSGGENDCDAHCDCMITSPTVDMTIEGKIVRLMENGRWKPTEEL